MRDYNCTINLYLRKYHVYQSIKDSLLFIDIKFCISKYSEEENRKHYLNHFHNNRKPYSLQSLENIKDVINPCFLNFILGYQSKCLTVKIQTV